MAEKDEGKGQGIRMRGEEGKLIKERGKWNEKSQRLGSKSKSGRK